MAPTTGVGGIRLLDPIGAGGTGRVHLAWDLDRSRHVAAKVLPATAAPTPILLDHPHLLRPLGRFLHGDHVLEISELVRGGSLADLLRHHGPLPEPYVVALLTQLLDALGAVHAAGLAHGDVKPGNVLLEPTGTGPPYAWLADPGATGTPGFSAPERQAGGPPGPADDVHALGVTTRLLVGGAGSLATLADTMTRPEPHRRPTAQAARRRLAELPVGRGGAWPNVPDRLAVDEFSPACGPRRRRHAGRPRRGRGRPSR